jgi:hypothetical protein
MGSLLLAAGTKGMRHSLPNSRIMIHQPSGGVQVKYLLKTIHFQNKFIKYFFLFKGTSNRHFDSCQRNIKIKKATE